MEDSFYTMDELILLAPLPGTIVCFEIGSAKMYICDRALNEEGSITL